MKRQPDALCEGVSVSQTAANRFVVEDLFRRFWLQMIEFLLRTFVLLSLFLKGILAFVFSPLLQNVAVPVCNLLVVSLDSSFLLLLLSSSSLTVRLLLPSFVLSFQMYVSSTLGFSVQRYGLLYVHHFVLNTRMNQ